MIPYSAGLILDNTNNYGIVKTETLFGFGPKNQANFIKDFNTSEPLEWMLANGKRTLEETSRSLNNNSTKPSAKTQTQKQHLTKNMDKSAKKKIKRKGKGKKCIYKIFNSGNGSNGGNKNKRNRNRMKRRYMMPMIIGLIAAKSILVPIALKALAFISAKGLMMGFFSTIMASLLSLKGMFDHSHGYQNRKDDSKTQVEIIHVPNHTDDHVYYDDHYKKVDYGPSVGMIKY